MNIRLLLAATLVAICCLPTGCGETTTPTGGTDVAGPPAPPPPPPPPAVDPPPPRAIAADDNVVKAESGVGAKGRGEGGGYVTVVARARFRAADSVQFGIMERALRDYKILNERLPRSHEEFMTEIIEKHAVQLPPLRKGEEYVYDPDEGELMVRRPKVGQLPE